MSVLLSGTSKEILESGSKKDHQPNQCIFKERIKRVLLYKVCQMQDKGVSAANVLRTCLINHDIWYDVMHKNLEIIRNEHELTCNDIDNM